MSDLKEITPEDMSDEQLEAALKGEDITETASTESEQTEVQAAPGQPEATEAKAEVEHEQVQEEVTQVPEKYKGKSQEELLRILQDQESYIGKLGNERSLTKRELDELRKEMNSREVAQSNSQVNSNDAELLRQGLEEDPADAVMKYIDNKVNSIEQREARKTLAQQEAEFESYYNEKISTDPDFLRRRDQLDVVADAIKPYFKPEMLKSKHFIDVVDLISKAADIDYYKNEAISRSLQTKENALKEKRNSKTESAYSQGSSATPSNPKEMTDEELEQALKNFSK